jgi:polar amino acid transport system permease protein
MTASAATAPKTQAQLIHELQQRTRRNFTAQVAVSWVIFMALLFFLFSGLKFTVGPTGTEVLLTRWEVQDNNRVKVEEVLVRLPIGLGAFSYSTITLDWAFVTKNWAFVQGGIWQTIGISALSIVLATLLALLAALGRLSKLPPVYALSTFYVSLIRGTPLFLQVIFFFLALPQLGINLPGLWAGVIALGLNYGAYMSEIFRAGLLSVGKGQREAALALGMTPSQMMVRIVIPQALRFAVPPTGNEFIAMLKDSALVSATGFVHEIMWRAGATGKPVNRNLEALLMAAVFYWIMTLIFTALQAQLEKYMARGDR